MGWIRFGYYAAKRVSRRSRRRQPSYAGLFDFMFPTTGTKRKPVGAQALTPTRAPTIPPLVAPDVFSEQSSWEWNESDLEYYRYATEKWKIFTLEHWGVLELPAGKGAAYNFFGIVQLHQDDDRGSLAYGAGSGGQIEPLLPVLLIFRIDDGYNDGFAAVQSWALVRKLIDQDRPLHEAGKYPRASL